MFVEIVGKDVLLLIILVKIEFKWLKMFFNLVGKGFGRGCIVGIFG